MLLAFLRNTKYSIQLLSRVLDIRLCCRKTRDGYAVRRAGYVIKSDFVAELYGRRVAAMFAADTAVKRLSFTLAEFNGSFHKFTYADGVKTCKRVAFVNLICVGRSKAFACVVPAEPESHLR